jgi:ketosteroid isomerase-like protein
MPAEHTNAASEAQIRAVIDDWADALRAKDVGGVMSHYAVDIVSFDLAPPLQYVGAAALRKSLAEWFSRWHGPIGYEIRDLSITASEDAAFSHSLHR